MSDQSREMSVEEATPRPEEHVGASDAAEAIDDPLLRQVRHIESLPSGERAAAFETLNRSLVSALGELEQL